MDSRQVVATTNNWKRHRHMLLVVLLGVYSLVVVRNAWLSDDAYITFRTVEQFLAGNGLVWNIGERVQTYTHPLWTFALILARAITGEYFYTVLALSLALSLAAVIVALRLVREHFLAPLVLGWLFVLSKALIDYSTSGLENPLSHLLLALFLWRTLRDEQTHNDPSARRLGLLSLIAACAILIRHDILLLVAPVLLWSAWQARRDRRAWLALALGMLPLVAWELFSLLYYGFPFPNTAYAKLNTAIAKAELIQQGLLYWLATISLDPVTILVLVMGVAAVAWHGVGKARALALGVILYLLYITYVGGDFMVGRFFSLPYFVMATLLVWTIRGQPQLLAAVAVAATITGLTNLAYSPLLFDPNEAAQQLMPSGIADEKAYYFAENGLQVASRTNRRAQQGFSEEATDPWDAECGGIGVRGFMASLHTHIVDTCGLADPLLARLPARHDPHWRVGHFNRIVPDGYLGSLHSGDNLLTDPDLATYYDKLNVLTRAPIFSWGRLGEIWHFNTGRYRHLINPLAYIYPSAPHLHLADLARATQTGDNPPPQSADGYFIALDEHASTMQLLIGIACASLDVDYYQRDAQGQIGDLLHSTMLHRATVDFGNDRLALIPLPEEVRAVTSPVLHLLPRDCEETTLHFVEAIPAANDASTAALTLEQLLDTYYVSFHRLHTRDRDATLAAIEMQLANYPPELWREIGVEKRVALLELPKGALYDMLLSTLGDSLPTIDLDDAGAMRYLGTSFEPEDGEIEVDMYFEVLEPVEEEPTLELHADLTQSPGVTVEFAISDDEATWETGTVQELSIDLPLPADAVNFTVCLVTNDAQPVDNAPAEKCWPM